MSPRPRPLGDRARSPLLVPPSPVRLLIAALAVACLGAAGPARADWIATPVERSLLVEADAFGSADSALDQQLDAAPGSAPYAAALEARAEADAPDLALPGLSSEARASQDSRLGPGALDVRLDSEARSVRREPGAFGSAAAESFFDVWLDLGPGLYRLDWTLQAASQGTGDAAVSLRLRDADDSSEIVARDLALSGLESDGVDLLLEEGTRLRLRAFARTGARANALAPGGLGRAALEVGLLQVPEPGSGALLLAALIGHTVGGRARRRRRGG